jgi:hypothetical protein
VPACVSSLIRVADVVRDHLPDQLTMTTSPRTGDVPVAVWHVLDTVPDPRRARGRRHSLATVIALAWGAVLAGATSLAAIGDGAADVPRWSWERWRIRRRPPGVSTIRRLLLGVDADVLDAVLHAWLATLDPPPSAGARAGTAALGAVTFRAVAVDGKTARGAVRGRHPGGDVLHGGPRHRDPTGSGRDHPRG